MLSIEKQDTLVRWIRYFIYGATIGIPLYPIVGDICVWSAVLLGAFYLSRKHLTWNWSILQTSVVGFILWSGLSTLNSLDPAFSSLSWLYNVGVYGAIYFLMFFFMREPVEQRRWLLIFLLTSVLVCAIGIYEYIYVVSKHVHEWIDVEKFPKLMRRMYATLQNPNLFGEYLLIVMGVVGTAILQELKEKRWKRLWWLMPLALLILGCAVLTYSRGIWISIAAMIVYWGIVIDKRLLLAFLVVPFVLWGYHGEVSGRLWSLFSGNDTSVMLRWALWDSTTYMIKEFPILGIGWDSFWFTYPSYNYFIQDPSVIIYHAHSTFLHIPAEIGLGGAAFYFFAILGHAWKVGRIQDEWLGYTLRYGLGAVVVGVLMSGFFDHNLYSHQISAVFWQLLGFGAAIVATCKCNIKN